MSESCIPLLSGSSSTFPWQSIGAEAPFPCLHVRMLHAKCGHVSFLECHEKPCPVPHLGWILEKIPPDPPSPCYEMKHIIRMKDEHCKVCQSYLDSPLTRTVRAVRGWFGRRDAAEKRVSPIALPQEAIDAIVLGWHLQIEHTKAQKMQFEEEQRERMQVCAASAVAGSEETSSGNSQETVVYVSSDEGGKSPAGSEEWLMTFE